MLSQLPEFENYSTSCDKSVNKDYFNRIYLINAVYLLPTLFLLFWILINIRVLHRDVYRNNLAYWIFTVECFVGIIHITLDLFVIRLFLYFPQLCSKYSLIFIKYPLINDIIFPLYNYCRVFKTVSQSSLILCRLFCVKFPMGNDRISKKYMPATLLIILSLPLVVISNTVISRKEVVFWYGGFFTVYHRRVGWMSLSVMHLFSLVFAIFTILISSMLIYRTLPSNLNSSIERSLFINSSFSAFGLILQASFQSYYGLFRYQTWFPQWIIHSQFVFYDFMTVGCPLMMVLSANEFRSQLFYCCEESTTKTTEYIEFQSLSKAKKGGGSRRRINENPSIHFDSLA